MLIRTRLGIAALAAGTCIGAADASVIGSLSTATGGVIGGGNYSATAGGFAIHWNITQNMDTTWTYIYSFTNAAGQPRTGPGVSHIVLELSENFTPADLLSVGSGIQTTTFGTFGPHPSNPGFPTAQTLSGVKFDVNAATISFNTTRAPMWGSFYTKGGSSSYAYNADINGPVVNRQQYWTPAVDASGSPLDMILVPDTLIPSPGPLALAGLAGLVATRRRR